MFYAYILKSISSGRHYYGHTSDLSRRLEQHNAGLSRYTKTRGPFEMIYFEEFDTRGEAMKREKFFKSIDGYHFLKGKEII